MEQNFPPIIPIDYSNELPQVPCATITIDQFNRQIISLKKNFSLFVLNMRSMRCNFSHFDAFLSYLGLKFDILVITEVWLSCNIDYGFDIPGYESLSLYRNTHGGGIKVYYKQNMSVSQIDDLTFSTDNVELLALDIHLAHLKFKLLCFYRPPRGSILNFNEFLSDQIFPKISDTDKVVLCGDLNINLFNPTKLLQIDILINLLCTLNYFPVIDKPTHLTPDNPITKYSLIDHIWSNFVVGSGHRSGVIDYFISDHLPIFYMWELNEPFVGPASYSFRDTISLNNRIAFLNDVSRISYDSWYMTDPCEAVKQFMSVLYQMYYKCFPLIKKSRKIYKGKPWVTDSIKQLVNKKHRLLNAFKRGVISHRSFRVYCRVLSCVLRICRENYYMCKLDKVKKSSRKMWHEMNSLMGRNKVRQKVEIKHSGEILNNPEAASHINEYFATVATNLAREFEPQLLPYEFHGPRVVNSCTFDPVTPEEIVTIVGAFGSKKRNVDEIQLSILNLIILMISPFLSFIFNRCIEEGVYPDVFKLARVVPIHKSGDKYNVSNYRPIGTLCIFNKIFEKLIHVRLSMFLEINNVLTHRQFGFKKASNTTLAMFTLITDLIQSFKTKSYVSALFLDLKKAFDTLDRDILMQKLYHYGIRNNVYHLIKSYLNNRFQYVILGEDRSPILPVPLGVVQGSVLGPLLFNIFINDVSLLGTKCVLFADDAVFYSHCKTLDESVYDMQQFINRLNNWLSHNRLTASESKTKLMLFTPCRKPSDMPVIIFQRSPLEWVKEIRYLGVLIDDGLLFRGHIRYVISKLSIIQGITYSLKRILPTSCLRTIFYSLAYPHIIQSVIIWGGVSNSNLQPIIMKINQILRNVLKVSYNSDRRPLVPTSMVYKKLSVLKFEDIYEFNLLKFVIYVSRLNGEIWTNYFAHLEPSHSYNIRNTGLNNPTVRTNVEKSGTIFQCVRALNNLPANLCDLDNIDIFKSRYKQFCFSKY